ncbi:MFS siderochrome iron transporter 1 [Colletotrichum orbiculare MAFF 240422]|uniref:MFS siderochrome iron transporter 1 n=1 Tax=Colletotrichum orbiculare (strain 104-T / ATCC 96160 / CBS 514.97 / LARS 414 / MAFF 240422) TaxID=1213857 RepID=N4VSD8_COLOR|nr:MFS siderochrome iron transporter 1 [Colletotrichum orbiculare MAFF 240422]
MSAPVVQQAPAEDHSQTQSLDEKNLGNTTTKVSAEGYDDSDDEKTEPQNGVKKIQAITSAWSYRALILTYVLIWVTSYTHSMQQQMNSNLSAYVTSSFSRHGLTATTGIVASLAGGVSQLPLAKILNIFGRMEGYILAHALCCFGLILMAVCRNVETYAAAQVFWAVGSGGIGYIHTVLISDTTSIRNRMIIYTLNSTAYIANAFAGPIVAELFEEKSTWRWAFGAFAIIFPVFGLLITGMLWWNLRKAYKNGQGPELTKSGRSVKESAVFYFREFDIVGMLLIMFGFSLFLLPFSLVRYAAKGWASGHIIAMIILGLFCLVLFGFWERMYAERPLVPWKNLKDRTILGSAATAGVIALSFSSWESYFSSYLQVVHRQSISQAGFIGNIYTIASCTWGPIVGLLIRQTNHYKWIACAAIPVACLSTGLLIHFRTPDTYIGYVIMCQILKAVSAGTIIICEQLAVMAVVKHNEVSVMLALIGLATSVGRSIGRAISGAIWTNEFLEFLIKYLPEDAQSNAVTIYGDIKVQLSYAWGSPTRVAIIRAYGAVQRHMVICGAAFMPLALGCVLLWRNVNVSKVHQTKGQVF